MKNKRNTGKQAFDIIRDKAAAARVVSEALARAVLDFEQEYLRFIVHWLERQILPKSIFEEAIHLAPYLCNIVQN